MRSARRSLRRPPTSAPAWPATSTIGCSLDDDAPIVVADVGWGGTIQEGLTRILRSEGIDREVVGLYFALSSPGEQRLARGARMWSYLPNEFDDLQAARHSRAIAHHADTIERIMTPEIGTLIDVTDDGTPVCRDPSEDPIPPTLASSPTGAASGHAAARRPVARAERLRRPTLVVERAPRRVRRGDRRRP